MKPVTIRVDRCPRCGTTLRERSNEKNAHLHAILGAIAKQKQWAGQWLDIEAWKRLMVAAYERAHGREVEITRRSTGRASTSSTGAHRACRRKRSAR